MTILSVNDNPMHAGPASPDCVPQSIGRLLDVFEAVVERNRCTLSEAAEVVGLTPTTARAVTERLRGEDELATLARRAQPHLHSLAVAAGESAYLRVRDLGLPGSEQAS